MAAPSHPLLTPLLPPVAEANLSQAVADATRAREWSEPWMGAFLEVMESLPAISRAAERVGISRRTVQRWIQRDEGFAVAVEDARQVALDRLEAIAYIRGSTGTPERETRTTTKTAPDGSVIETTTVVIEGTHVNDQLLLKYLQRFRPEFRDSYRVEQTGADGGPIRIRIDEASLDHRISDLLAGLGAGA